MAHPIKNETGAEIIQLAFAMPVLILIFFLSAQFCIWASYSVQFANAADYAVSHVDLDQVRNFGWQSQSFRALIAEEIASKMVGVNASDITISDVSFEPVKSSASQVASSNGAADSDLQLYEATSRVTFKFSAHCSIPSLFSKESMMNTEGCWQRERVLSKTSEVRDDRA